MPGREYEGAVMMTESRVLGSLKAHKALPRRSPSPPDSTDLRSARRRQSPRPPLKTRDRAASATSDRLGSWVQDSSGIQAVPVIGQPLTPPINFRDNFKSWIDDKALRDREFLSQQKISPGNTPLIAQSPPTPETTPPRPIYKSRALKSLPTSRNVSDGSTETALYVPESRTDSFKTAHENLSSDEESFQPDSPSKHPARQVWLRDAGLIKQKDVGLGLGLESDDDQLPTPKEILPPQKAVKNQDDFVTFDGFWGSDTPNRDVDSLSQVTAQRNSNERDREAVREIIEQPHLDSPTLGIEARSLSKKETKSRRKIDERRRNISAEKKERNRERTHSPWPLKGELKDDVGMDDLDAEIREVNDKRHSQASTTSTIVEAMVIESPPQRRQTLRHTGKMMRVESLHSQQSRSNRGSLQSDDHTLKHQSRNTRKPDQGLRKRFVSETTPNEIQESTLAKLEGSSVVVIPDRRSSLPSSTDSSRRLSKTFSVNSKQQSSRPTTAPEGAVGYFDVPRRERKSVSVVIQQAIPLKTEKKVEKDDLPTTAAEMSSTPVTATATTKGHSRTTSVTSAGMATHYIPQTPTSQRTTSPHTTETLDNQITTVDRSSSGDWGALRPRSALVTPFSLRSAHSSTPGTLEVNEATAISIYPHTNKSILVIQEMAGRDDSSPREQSAVIAGNANIALPSAFAPVVTQPALPSPPRDLSNSPLQNPREPPQPPDFKIIPPTPANAASSSEDTVRNVKKLRRSNRFSAPFVSLKRAMSARRYSESVSNPFIFTRTLSLRDTTGRPRPRTAEDKDGQLHPFWRPRAFWDGFDGSDSDSEFGNNGTLSPRGSSSHGTPFKTSNPPRRSVSLASRFTGSLRSASTRRPILRRASISLTSDVVPKYSIAEFANVDAKPKRTASLSRKIGGSLRLPSNRRPRPRRSSTADWHNQPDYEFVHADDRQTDDNIPPRQGYPVQFGNVGFRNIAERIERRRSIREEGKREERRNWLKARIGLVGPKDVTGFDIIHPTPHQVVADD